MAEFQIFSDGACDMEKEVAEKYHIKMIPFYVSLDHTNYYKEIEELPLSSFYKNILEEHGYPKTSLPSVQDYVDAFTPVLDEGKDILCLTITDTLSGSYQSAVTAKLMLEESYPHAKIYVLNSWHATGSQLLLLIEAAKMQAAGYGIDDVYAFTEKCRVDGRIIFMVGALNHLEKGGRIGKIAALSGSILNIKPIIILNGGEINVGGVSRGRKKGLLKLVELTKQHFQKTGENPENYTFIIGVTDIWDEIDLLSNTLKDAFPNIELRKPFQIGAAIASHTGPGTVGICFVKKFDAYLS
ncbi:MAG: DegV family protein [Epulopiscium sp.]|nr:DegV family protein [Candidatus Epulonipiscium sp.]